MHSINQQIFEKARTLGFDAVGIAPPELPLGVAEGLREFLGAGHHGEMHWMEARSEMRGSPRALWPEVESVIVVAQNYAPAENPMQKLAEKNIGNISAYAQNLDYHDVMKPRLKQLARWLVETHGGDVKVFVDTAPVMEKPLAELAGIGWQGKHTCLVSRDFGSWLFLGCIFTTLKLAPSHNHAPSLSLPRIMAGEGTPSGGGSHCGSCTQCLDVCPTQAFTGAGKLDATRCIAYLTIEHKGQIPVEFRRAMGNRIYGCDDCLAVCPWNKFAQASKESAYHAREELKSPQLADLLVLDDAAFRKLFAKSPVKRIGRERFIRNVLVAAGNSGDASLMQRVQALKEDGSAIVAEMAAWAEQSISL